jgi:decaprenylphospho-beta-D-erythro-pentofuranosid-2-ulose 2-reductase
MDRHTAFLDDLGPLPYMVVCAVGLLGDQAISERDAASARLVMDTNYVAPVLLLGEIANRMEQRGSGVIVGISSVAGERGRASNYVYGSAKAGFTAFLSGLRARLARRGVRVITVKPGFVATRMTAGMKLPPILTAKPKDVADGISKAIRRHRDVVYVRGIWMVIMALIRALPEPLAKRLHI